jgi:formylglycine-generating enzyme required for sulfatase activity
MFEPRAEIPAEVDEYRIVRLLAETTLGATYLAHDRRLDRAVVLRFVPADPATAAALLQAARALARASHAAICGVHRVRETSANPYVVSTFAHGVRLSTMRLPLELPRAREVAAAVAGAVASLHGAGIVHGRVDASHVFLADDGTTSLVGLSTARVACCAEDTARDVKDLVALIDAVADTGVREFMARGALSDGAGPSAADVCRALDRMAAPPRTSGIVVENPYRGLLPYEARHASLFFGREAHVDDALARLRDEPWLVIAGHSGAGKSSVVLAGLVPRIQGGALGERTRWDVLMIAPGAVQSLQTRLAQADPDEGLLVVVDRFEEILALPAGPVRSAVLGALASFRTLTPGRRALLTMRSEFLPRAAELGALGRDLLRATYLLPPMSPEGLRAAAVAPAASRGFRMESPAMVDALLADVAGQAQALPMLSFALHELWVRRDRQRAVLSEAALAAIGGAAGALARHGDTTVASLRPNERSEARRILVQLTSDTSARVRHRRQELLAGDAIAGAAALDALVDARIVVAGAEYELSHGALAGSWPRLRDWIDEASDVRKMERRLEAAAAQWMGLGRRADALWSARHLRDLALLGAPFRGSDGARAFLRASRSSIRRQWARRWGTRLGLPVIMAAVALGVAGWRKTRDREEAATVVGAHLADARSALEEARRLDASAREARADAFERFDADDARGGEARFSDANTLTERASAMFAAAATATDLALARDPLDARAREASADVLYDWMKLAEARHPDALSGELAQRLRLVDDGGARMAAWTAPAQLRVVTAPPGATVVLRRVRVTSEGRRVEDEGAEVDGEPAEVAPGSYVLDARMPGRWSTRLPLLLRRGQDERVEIVLPAAANVPAGFVYVPSGWSLFGSTDGPEVRGAAHAQPEHSVHGSAFLIAERETTFSEYLAFLATLPRADRALRCPAKLVCETDGAPVYTGDGVRLEGGQPLCRPKRTSRRCQDWLRLPVDLITWDDAQAYARWVAGTRTPGARLCADREWERAARGADGRLFAHGDELRAGDANFQATYGVDADQMGSDEVGSFPLDRSVFGVLDLIGNVSEWVADSIEGDPDFHKVRGGNGFNVAFNARATTGHSSASRGTSVGLRLCAAVSGATE